MFSELSKEDKKRHMLEVQRVQHGLYHFALLAIISTVSPCGTNNSESNTFNHL